MPFSFTIPFLFEYEPSDSPKCLVAGSVNKKFTTGEKAEFTTLGSIDTIHGPSPIIHISKAHGPLPPLGPVYKYASLGTNKRKGLRKGKKNSRVTCQRQRVSSQRNSLT
jgi:hypothetical protein